MDEILRKMNEVSWVYADKGPAALEILARRVNSGVRHCSSAVIEELMRFKKRERLRCWKVTQPLMLCL